MSVRPCSVVALAAMSVERYEERNQCAAFATSDQGATNIVAPRAMCLNHAKHWAQPTWRASAKHLLRADPRVVLAVRPIE